jgi:hypothetical protein
MTSIAIRALVLAMGLAMGLALGACSPEPQDEIRERLSKDLKDAGRGASDAERDEVAGALAEDFVTLGKELEQSLAALKQIESAPPDGEIRTDDELESIQAEIERIATQLQETCVL